jgi:hypothetical protein
MTVEIHIDELVLDGVHVHPAAGPRVGRVVEREIARLVARDGLAPQHRLPGSLPALRAPGITTTATPDPGVLARDVARAVVRGLGR